MSSAASPIKVTLLSSGVLLLSGFIVGGTYIGTGAVRSERAERLTVVGEGQLTNGQIAEAAVSLQVAQWLDNRNSHTLVQSARLAVERGRAPEAIELLNRVTDTTTTTTTLRMRAQALNGQVGEAAATAGQILQKPDIQADDARVALALLKFTTPNSTVPVTSYSAIGPQGGLERLQAIASDNVSAAQELYAQRLLSASKAVLDCVEIKSVAYYHLQATLELTGKSSTQKLMTAREYLEKAIAIDPSSVTARKLLISVNERLKDESAANKQRELLHQLESGQI